MIASECPLPAVGSLLAPGHGQGWGVEPRCLDGVGWMRPCADPPLPMQAE